MPRTRVPPALTTDPSQASIGPQGPPGSQGPQGNAGATGPKGDDGEGWQGAMGETGPAGPAGAQGPQGATGPAGAAGAPGTTGATGPAGAQGPAGPAGVQGPQGSVGATGAKGDTGDTGPTGAQGPQGLQGQAGAAGATGSQGPKGDTGAQGIQGTAGNTGPTGLTGPTGPAGTPATPAPWEGRLHLALGDGYPNDGIDGLSSSAASVAGPTPTGIGTTVGRLQAFRFRVPITVATLRFFGAAAVSGAYTLAIYNATTGARVFLADPLNVAAGWNAVAGNGLVLAADTPYWLGLGAKAASAVAGLRTPASPIANSLGLVSLPGSLNSYGPRFAQAALVAGAWPATLPALAAAVFASGGSTGTLPGVFFDVA